MGKELKGQEGEYLSSSFQVKKAFLLNVEEVAEKHGQGKTKGEVK